jgi:thiamine kinase-like enzyme
VAVVPDAADLQPAFEEARHSDRLMGEPGEFLLEFDRVGTRRADVRLCIAHGDLQVRNVFARRHPRVSGRLTDVVLIDFERAGVDSHAARDLATLDVSLTLDTLKGLPDLGFDAAAELFPNDLLDADALPQRDRRDIAVGAVRAQARHEGLDSVEYAISLSAHLARYAKFLDTQGVARCAVAYRLAWRVIQGL